MRNFPVPTPTDLYDYLLRVYFGSNVDPLSCCISRAYRDMSRTLHGLAQVSEGKEVHERASAVVRSFLTSLQDTQGATLAQPSFDNRHETACTTLCLTYKESGFASFRIGQAQKWLNMALKYVFVFGEERLPGYSSVFPLAHVPLDNIILERLSSRGVPQLTTRWSRVNSYDEYMGVQRWIRSEFQDSAPLAVEFALWSDSGAPDCNDESLAEPDAPADRPRE